MRGLVWIGLALLVGLFVVISSNTGGDNNASEPTTSATQTAVPQATPDTPKPPAGVKFSTSPGADGEVVFAQFQISDNFTQGMIRDVAQLDTVDILKYARDAYPNASKIVVRGSFPMTDAYGNTSNDVILNVSYDRATLEKINFDGVNPKRIWDLRDSGMVHPELQ